MASIAEMVQEEQQAAADGAASAGVKDRGVFQDTASGQDGYQSQITNDNFAAQQAALRQAPTSVAANIGAASTINANNLNPAAMAAGTTLDQSQSNQFRQGQQSLVGQLQAQANGTGPSLAQNQLQLATNRNIAQQLGVAATTSGQMNGAASLRQSALSSAAANQGLAQNSATLRLQEQLQAQQELNDALSSGRSQDLSAATTQAGLTQQTALANQNASNNQNALQANILQGNQSATNANMLAQSQLNQQTNLANQTSAFNQQQINDANQQYYQGQALGIGERETDLANAGQVYGTNTALGVAASTQAQQNIDNANTNAELATAGKAAATILPLIASDERAKENIVSGKSDLRAFLNTIGAHKYNYKDDKHGEGTFVSPMAQELEKTKLGKSAVEEENGIKKVNYGRLIGTTLSAQSMLNERLDTIENIIKTKNGLN